MKEFKFISTTTTVDISYAKATNKEYQQYYKDTIDPDFEVDDNDMAEYDGYIVLIGNEGMPEWYSKNEFHNVFIDIETED